MSDTLPDRLSTPTCSLGGIGNGRWSALAHRVWNCSDGRAGWLCIGGRYRGARDNSPDVYLGEQDNVDVAPDQHVRNHLIVADNPVRRANDTAAR
jgi:hypothetical protein